MYVTYMYMYMYMCRYKLPVSCLNWYRIIIKVTYRSMEQVKCLTPRQSFSLFYLFFFLFIDALLPSQQQLLWSCRGTLPPLNKTFTRLFAAAKIPPTDLSSTF